MSTKLSANQKPIQPIIRHSHQALFAHRLVLTGLLLVVNTVATFAAYTVSNTTELIAALVKANAASGITSIYLKPGTYTILTPYQNTDNAFPKITGKVNLVGLFNGAIIARPGSTVPPFRFFEVSTTGQLWLDRLTFSQGVGNGSGGAILNYGSLTINSSYFLRNIAVNSNGEATGGAIYNRFGKLVIRNSTFLNNRAEFGGAVCSDGSLAAVPAAPEIAQVTIEASALLENAAQFKGYGALGGGVCLRGANETDLHDTTFTANFAQRYGGGLALQRIPKVNRLSLRNLTVYNNQASLDGGGIYYDAGTLPYSASAYLELQNSIVTCAPTTPIRDLAGNGVIKSFGYNIYGTYENYFSDVTDFNVPGLAYLSYHDDNKPGDQYWLPEPGCVALNNGNPANNGAFDQIGTTRGPISDIGAVERP